MCFMLKNVTAFCMWHDYGQIQLFKQAHNVKDYLKCYHVCRCDNHKGKAMPVQAQTGPEGSRRLRLPDFKTIGSRRWYACQPYALPAFIP
jgi:hypothetical protein